MLELYRTHSIKASVSFLCCICCALLLLSPLQANCIDSTAAPEAVFASEVKKMSAENMKPQEQLTLEPYERDHAVVVGIYRYTNIRFIEGDPRCETGGGGKYGLCQKNLL